MRSTDDENDQNCRGISVTASGSCHDIIRWVRTRAGRRLYYVWIGVTIGVSAFFMAVMCILVVLSRRLKMMKYEGHHRQDDGVPIIGESCWLMMSS
eukprot:SAG25_NODE_373_length_8948_cov_6.275059_6_plen_96_part_00